MSRYDIFSQIGPVSFLGTQAEKYETKIMRKEMFMDPVLCLSFGLIRFYERLYLSEDFKMELKRLSTLHVIFI
jgi:hypothetical protein